MTATAPADPRRKAEIGKIKIGAKSMALDDDAYRALLQRLTGRTSAAELSAGERAAVLDEMQRLGAFGASARRPGQRHLQKVRALWASLYNLAAIDSDAGAALDAFVRRQTGVDRAVWLRAGQAAAVIEALKAIGARHGWTVPADPTEAKRALIRAQIARLSSIHADLPGWVRPLDEYGDQDLDAIATGLGRRLRAALAAR